MIRCVQDQAYSSAQVGGPLAPVGGAAFQAAPNLEAIDAVVLDNRTSGSTGLGLGKLFVEQFLAANSGDANYTPSATANAAIKPFSYGILVGIPNPPVGNPANPPVTTGGGLEIRIRQYGVGSAFCTTGTTAIAVGSLLVADGAGNLTTPSAIGTAPSAGSATPYGTTGAATVTYQVYSRNAFGLDSAASANISTATANATLSATNGIVVAATIAATTTQVVIVRTVGGATQGIIGILNVPLGATTFSFLDFGQAAMGAYAAPTTPVFAAGQVLAVAEGALAASTVTATLVQVNVGGY